ncbi:MAG: hypothetical protein AUH78_24480 [Gemmatimonadetes bacterium 13_1_40CM_4_69_8]|nr:MAG: hypothetical protein AUH78_24480 [Gemmatimonadetes bacterium 13_1_40CM_4_69_8]
MTYSTSRRRAYAASCACSSAAGADQFICSRMRRMSVAGSLTTQSPGLQFFISPTSRLLIVTAATSDSIAGLLKTPS